MTADHRNAMPQLRPVTWEEQVWAALFATVAGGLAAWGARLALANVWEGPSRHDLWGWTVFSWAARKDNPALHREWSTMWEIGFQHYLTVLATAAIVAFGFIFAIGSRRPIGSTLKAVAIGAAIGVVAGFIVGFVPGINAFHAAMAQPAGVLFLGAFAAFVIEPARPDPVVRGTRIENRPMRRKRSAVDEAIQNGQVVFANELVDPNNETTHFVAEGASGTGKTTVTKALLATAIARGDQMIVADPGGEFMEDFLRDGDVILNPFDERCAKWCPFSEIKSPVDYDNLSAALLPFSGDANSQYWIKRGRALLSAVMRVYHQLDAGDSDAFAHFMLTATPDMMAELCEGTSAASLFNPGNEKLLGSVLTEMAPAVEYLAQMAQVKGAPFSIKDWTVAGRGRLWLPYRIDQLNTLRPAIASWIGIASMKVMSMPKSDTRRVWFVIDELDMLGRVPDLEKGLTNGRRYGACFALGFQSISQLRETYGNNVAATIEENIATKLILRCEGFGQDGTAEHASRMIGEREVAFEDVSTNAPSGKDRTGSTTRSLRHRVERAVLPAEISQLPNLTGYMKRPGDAGWQKVVVPVRNYPEADVTKQAA